MTHLQIAQSTIISRRKTGNLCICPYRKWLLYDCASVPLLIRDLSWGFEEKCGQREIVRHCTSPLSPNLPELLIAALKGNKPTLDPDSYRIIGLQS